MAKIRYALVGFGGIAEGCGLVRHRGTEVSVTYDPDTFVELPLDLLGVYRTVGREQQGLCRRGDLSQGTAAKCLPQNPLGGFESQIRSAHRFRDGLR